MDRIKAIARGAFIPAALTVLTLAAFWPAWDNGFIKFDDLDYVTGNSRVKAGLSWSNVAWALQANVSANWHPVTMLSHMLDVQLFGLRPGWHHFMSVLLHAASALLLFQFLREATGADWRSAWVAALFAVHPLRVESVAWVAERKDVLSGLFLMLLLWAYGRYARPPPGTRPARRWYVACLAFLMLGLMSKPMLVTAPFLLLLLDLWPLQRSAPSRLMEKIPFLVLTAVSCGITFQVQQRHRALAEGLPLDLRAANAIASYWKYLGQMAWPAKLAIFYQHPSASYFAPPGGPAPTAPGQWPAMAIAAAALALALLSALALAAWRRRPWLTTGWFWYLGMLVPVIGLVQVGGQAMADRYTYLPLIGIFICLSWTAGSVALKWPTARWALAGLGTLVVLACVAQTRRQVAYWRDNLTVFQHAIEVNPHNALAQCQVGIEWGERKEFERALAHLDTAKQADPTFAESYRGKGITLELLERPAEALAEYQAIEQIKPSLDWPYARTAALLWKQGRHDEALSQYRTAVQFNPTNAETLALLGAALVESGSAAEAVPYLSEALRLDPEQPDAVLSLALVAFLQGRLPEAETHYRAYARLNPTNGDARVNLGGVLWRLGRRAEAQEQYQMAVNLSPTNALAHFNLGNALAVQGKLAEAVTEFDAASRLKPGYVEALGESGKAMLSLKRFGEARSRFAAALESAPMNASLHLQLGSAWQMEGQTNQAAACFQKALALDPQLPAKLMDAGKSLAGRGQVAAALERFQSLLWLQPDNPGAKAEIQRLHGAPPPP